MLEPTDWPPEDVSAFRAAVLEYFEHERRNFPWREAPDPYGVLVSEFMLQQTRTETVVPYFRRWMRSFPDIERLAEAMPETVLREWEGLGYYSRARNLHRSAREIMARYGGEVPREPAELRTLPGVGEYTAGAVASIAFGVPAAAVDGNVRRVMSRIADSADPKPRRLREWVEALVDPGSPGAFNQGLMEIGSRVCSPRAPSCGTCPLARWCRARVAGTQEERPLPKRARAVPHFRRAVAAIVRTGPSGADRTLCVRRRPDEGLLARMWELPSVRIGQGDDAARSAAAIADEFGSGRKTAAAMLHPVRHAFTHRKVTYEPFLFFDPAPSGPDGEGKGGDGAPIRWVSFAELKELPIPVAQRKIIGQVIDRPGFGGVGPLPPQPPNSRPDRPLPPSGD